MMLLLWPTETEVLVFCVPLGMSLVTVNTSLVFDFPVQYKPAYTMLEQLGIAPFSVDNTKVEEEELNVVGSESASTYCMNCPLLLVFGP